MFFLLRHVALIADPLVQILVQLFPLTPIVRGFYLDRRFDHFLPVFIGEQCAADRAGPVLFAARLRAGRLYCLGVLQEAVVAFDRHGKRLTAHAAALDVCLILTDLPVVAFLLIIRVIPRNLNRSILIIDKGCSLVAIDIFYVLSVPGDHQSITVRYRHISRVFIPDPVDGMRVSFFIRHFVPVRRVRIPNDRCLWCEHDLRDRVLTYVDPDLCRISIRILAHSEVREGKGVFAHGPHVVLCLIGIDLQIGVVQYVRIIVPIDELPFFIGLIKSRHIGLGLLALPDLPGDRNRIPFGDCAVTGKPGLSQSVIESLIHLRNLRTLCVADRRHRNGLVVFDRDLRLKFSIIIVVQAQNRRHFPVLRVTFPWLVLLDAEVSDAIQPHAVLSHPVSFRVADECKGWFCILCIAVINIQPVAGSFGHDIVDEFIFIRFTETVIDLIFICRLVLYTNDRALNRQCELVGLHSQIGCCHHSAAAGSPEIIDRTEAYILEIDEISILREIALPVIAGFFVVHLLVFIGDRILICLRDGQCMTVIAV